MIGNKVRKPESDNVHFIRTAEKVVGLSGFEPESMAPKATSIPS